MILKIGHIHLHFRDLRSTNDYAIDCLSKSSPSAGTVISADFQTAGRGQYGRNWEAQAGQSVLMSVILKPEELPVDRIFALNFCVALAIQEALGNLSGKEVSIKWPNDIYYQGNKLGGILIQNGFRQQQIQWSVIGIGVNILQKSFPEALPNPISLTQIHDRPYVIKDCIQEINVCLSKWYNLFIADKIPDLKLLYREQNILFNSHITFEIQEGKVLEGIVTDFLENGNIEIQIQNGSKLQFQHGDINITNII